MPFSYQDCLTKCGLSHSNYIDIGHLQSPKHHLIGVTSDNVSKTILRAPQCCLRNETLVPLPKIDCVDSSCQSVHSEHLCYHHNSFSKSESSVKHICKCQHAHLPNSATKNMNTNDCAVYSQNFRKPNRIDSCTFSHEDTSYSKLPRTFPQKMPPAAQPNGSVNTVSHTPSFDHVHTSCNNDSCLIAPDNDVIAVKSQLPLPIKLVGPDDCNAVFPSSICHMSSAYAKDRCTAVGNTIMSLPNDFRRRDKTVSQDKTEVHVGQTDTIKDVSFVYSFIGNNFNKQLMVFETDKRNVSSAAPLYVIYS